MIIPGDSNTHEKTAVSHKIDEGQSIILSSYWVVHSTICHDNRSYSPMRADANPIMAIRPTNTSFFLVKPKPCKKHYAVRAKFAQPPTSDLVLDFCFCKKIIYTEERAARFDSSCI